MVQEDPSSRGLTVVLCSFGFEEGSRVAAAAATRMFDCRHITNPSKQSRKGRTGLDKRLRDEVLQSPGCREFVKACAQEILDDMAAASARVQDDATTLTFGFGCARGKHRSVSICLEVERVLIRSAQEMDSSQLESFTLDVEHLNISQNLK